MSWLNTTWHFSDDMKQLFLTCPQQFLPLHFPSPTVLCVSVRVSVFWGQNWLKYMSIYFNFWACDLLKFWHALLVLPLQENRKVSGCEACPWMSLTDISSLDKAGRGSGSPRMPSTRTLASTWQHPSKPFCFHGNYCSHREKRLWEEEVGGRKMEWGR